LPVLEAPANEAVDSAVRDADGSSPFGGAVAVLYSSAAPAYPDAALRIAGFLMQVSLPDAARMIVGRNFVPAGVAQESIFDSRRTAMLELIALNMVATAGKRNEAFARRCPRMPCAQGFADAHPVQLVRKQPGQTAFRA